MPASPEKLLLAAPRGYCAGVDRAVQTVEHALELYGAPVYVRKEIVHNKHVVAQLRERGAIFVEELDDSIPEGAVTVFSAHGVSPAVHADAERRALRTIDATCPLVTKVHREAVKFAGEGYTIVLIGHADHVETIPDLVKRIYVDVSPRLHPVAALSVESHLKKLAREHRVHEDRRPDQPSRWTAI